MNKKLRTVRYLWGQQLLENLGSSKIISGYILGVLISVLASVQYLQYAGNRSIHLAEPMVLMMEYHFYRIAAGIVQCPFYHRAFCSDDLSDKQKRMGDFQFIIYGNSYFCILRAVTAHHHYDYSKAQLYRECMEPCNDQTGKCGTEKCDG